MGGVRGAGHHLVGRDLRVPRRTTALKTGRLKVQVPAGINCMGRVMRRDLLGLAVYACPAARPISRVGGLRAGICIPRCGISGRPPLEVAARKACMHDLMTSVFENSPRGSSKLDWVRAKRAMVKLSLPAGAPDAATALDFVSDMQ